MPLPLRPVTIAAVYGALAGALAAVTLWGMQAVSHLVWSVSDARWYVALVIMVGGMLIALMRRSGDDVDLEAQLAQASDPLRLKRRRTLLLALSAIVAVGFGGAIGPEAGLLAVVSEASAIVALRIARSQAEARLIGDAGAVAALSGLYSAPPGATAYVEPKPATARDAADAPTPLALKFLGAVTGFAAFLLVARWLMPSVPLGIALPPYASPRDGSELAWAIVPATLGAGAGVAFLWCRERIAALLARLGNPVVQTLAGSAAFALLATALPLLRFSGHHDMAQLLAQGVAAGWPALLALGLLKALALALCLASGWRGGEVFPLIFAGAAVALPAVALLPGLPVTVALVAGMGAATAAGMRKPIAALLIVLLITGVSAPGALCVGVLVGHAVTRRWPVGRGGRAADPMR